ncbi:Non-specific serine/threonine protein kinase [Mycena venus]|uniref:Non-specific serine/threonine protein kinase n=1 Tax=Mycena venus TaxID=2733690 RepID=A0A8H6U362_9AGAR|nr:Non-specific serine/threonine protein kinase [Mycena venus]
MSVKVKDGKSRFSVFKFGRNAAPRPPPPPPKDAVYLAAIGNRSLASLSPESLPASPLSGDQYAASSSSAVSLSLPQQPKQRSGLFKFGTVSRKTVEVPPSPAEDDENISMPWNFQHNVHVDEGFTGLPPSWTTSLQEAGFSDDEIAAIQQRRLADRPRAQSPCSCSAPYAPKHIAAKEPAGPAYPCVICSQYSSPKIEYASPKVDYTSPKTDYTSLKADNAKADNLRAPPSPKSPPPVYWRDEQPQPLSVPRRQPQPQQVDSRSAHSQRSLSPSPPPSRSLSPSRPLQQQQPPRAFSPALSQSQSNHSQHSHHSQPQSQAHSRSQSQQSQHSSFSDDELDELDEPAQSRSPSPARKAPSNLKNLTLDLDLSLGDPASTWSEGVLSATPWSASLKPNFEDKPAASPSSPLFTLTAPGRTEAALSDGDEFSPTAAYYAGSVTAGAAGKKERVVSTGSGEGSPRLAYDFDDYAYDERDYASDRGQSRPPSTDDKDRLDVTRDRDNRDSGMSDVTMLAPPPSAGIVSRIAVARRAVAEVVGMPAAPRVAPPARA